MVYMELRALNTIYNFVWQLIYFRLFGGPNIHLKSLDFKIQFLKLFKDLRWENLHQNCSTWWDLKLFSRFLRWVSLEFFLKFGKGNIDFYSQSTSSMVSKFVLSQTLLTLTKNLETNDIKLASSIVMKYIFTIDILIDINTLLNKFGQTLHNYLT
jgi:hypothetical protein